MRPRATELGVSVPRLLVESALAGVQTPTERRQMTAGLFEVAARSRPSRTTSPNADVLDL